MKIERINENQIRCTLSSFDLSSRDLNIRELAYGSEKARNLFREMVQKASSEVGFEAEDIPLMVEAIPLSNESIMLVITKIEDPEELDTRFSKFSPYTDETPDFLSDLAGGTLEGADELLKLFSGFKIPEGDEEASLENQTEADDDGYEESAQKTASRVFLFTSLDQVSEAARACDGLYDGINTLYKRPETSQYYLVIRSDGSDLRSFSRVCNILSEYGTKTRKLPYTVRSGSAFLQQMDVSVEEASISLGVSPMKTFFHVTARLMAPGILSGAILSWITCINELSSSVMLYGGKTSTISVAIYTEVVRNSFGTAAALASILTVSTVISLLIFLKVSKGKVSVV